LSAFLAVADERSFTRAAKRLNLSTSGLSHAIRRLEEQIGVRVLPHRPRVTSHRQRSKPLLVSYLRRQGRSKAGSNPEQDASPAQSRPYH
jgi:DNA-binding transcriptional LysR family regulator